MNGPDFPARVDQGGIARPPVIFMSAYADSHAAAIAELPPQATFIAKPFDKAALLAMIASALASRP
jgi:FixJ family two-component response regulator